VDGWKSVSKPVGNTNCRPQTGALLTIGNAMFRKKYRLPFSAAAAPVFCFDFKFDFNFDFDL
jgi:hypothetical protein